MIDPLNIFQEIKNVVNAILPKAIIFAFGSRLSGVSTANKWDFDVCIYTFDMKLLSLCKERLKSYFNGRFDENNKPIKVDLFAVRVNTLEEFKKIRPYAILL